MYLFSHVVSSLSGAVKRVHSRFIHHEGGPRHGRTDGFSPCLSLSCSSICLSVLHTKPHPETMALQRYETEVGKVTHVLPRCWSVEYNVCVCVFSKPQTKQTPEDMERYTMRSFPPIVMKTHDLHRHTGMCTSDAKHKLKNGGRRFLQNLVILCSPSWVEFVRLNVTIKILQLLTLYFTPSNVLLVHINK